MTEIVWPDQSPTLAAQPSFDFYIHSTEPRGPERYDVVLTANRDLSRTGTSKITTDMWRERDWASDHYLNRIMSGKIQEWRKFFNTKIPVYYLTDPLPPHKGWATNAYGTYDPAPQTAWDVISRYQAGKYSEWSEDRDLIARNNRINNQCLDWLFRIVPLTTTNMWVYRCEGERSIQQIIDGPCLTRHYSTTLSFLFALNGQFCSKHKGDRLEWKRWPRPGTPCSSKYVLDKANFNIISIFIPAGSQIIPIWAIEPGSLNKGLITPQQDWMEENKKVTSHEFYVYQKEVLLPRGGMLRPYIRKGEIACKQFLGRTDITWVPIFQYFSPSVQSVRDSCRTFIQMDRRGEKYDGERNMYFNRIWDGRDSKEGYDRGGGSKKIVDYKKKKRRYTKRFHSKNKTKKLLK